MRRTMLSIVCLASRVAFADEPPPDRAISPGFVLLDRFDATSRVGLEAGYMRADGDGSGRLDVHGQFVGAHGIGGYVQIQAGEYLGDVPMLRVGARGGVGAPEIGALLVTRPGDAVDLVYRIGVVFPPVDVSYYPVEAIAARPSDTTQHVPDLGFVRGSVSVLVRGGRAFGRIDAAFDRSVYSTNTGNDANVAGSIARVGAGVGWDLGHVALMAELTASTATLERETRPVIRIARDTTARGTWLVAPALTVRGRYGRIQPYASLVYTLGEVSAPAASVGFDVAL